MSAVNTRTNAANDQLADQRGDLPAWDPASGIPRKPRWWRRIIAAFLVGIGVGFFVLPSVMPMLFPPPADPAAVPAAPATETAEATPTTMILNPMEITTLAPQELRSVIRITGSVDPERETRLSAKVSATIDRIAVLEGQAVAEGDVLLEFDADELGERLDDQRASLASARVQLETAQANLERTQTLVARSVATQATLDTAQAQVSQAQASVASLDAQVRSAERALENATVHAPYAGVIAQRDVAEGETVSIGSPLLTIVDLSSVEIEAMVPTMAIASVAPGQRATIAVTGIGGRTFDAEVERISPTAPEGGHAVAVYLALENPDGVLRGGMFATGNILVDTKANAIALAPSAIRNDDNGPYVLKVVGPELVRQDITLGPTWNQGALVEITQGLSAGDVVVTAPLPGLEAGVPVTVEGA